MPIAIGTTMDLAIPHNSKAINLQNQFRSILRNAFQLPFDQTFFILGEGCEFRRDTIAQFHGGQHRLETFAQCGGLAVGFGNGNFNKGRVTDPMRADKLLLAILGLTAATRSTRRHIPTFEVYERRISRLMHANHFTELIRAFAGEGDSLLHDDLLVKLL